MVVSVRGDEEKAQKTLLANGALLDAEGEIKAISRAR